MTITTVPNNLVSRAIGILGGTFDPIHNGHIALAQTALRELHLQKLLMIPAGQPWQKQGRSVSPAADRLHMTRLAVQHEPQIEVDDCEVRRSGPSYMIDTLQALRTRFGTQTPFILLMGSDQLARLATWHRWQELLHFSHIAYVIRGEPSSASAPAEFPPEIRQWLLMHHRSHAPATPSGTVLSLHMPPYSVSSTWLRQQLAQGRFDLCRPHLAPSVADFLATGALHYTA